MHPVLPGDGVVRAVAFLRLETRGQHRPQDVGETDLFVRGDFDADTAEVTEIEVQVVHRAVGAFDPARQLTDATGRTEDHASVVRLERLDNGGGGVPVRLADALFVGPVLMIVHAVAGRGDGRLEP